MSSMCASWRARSPSIAAQTSGSVFSSVGVRENMAGPQCAGGREHEILASAHAPRRRTPAYEWQRPSVRPYNPADRLNGPGAPSVASSAKTAALVVSVRLQEPRVKALLAFSRLVDAINTHVGKLVTWLVLVAVLISAGNAIVRKTLDYSSNAWLEVQWYLFSAVFLLCAGFTLLRNEHIRIDVVAGNFSRRTQTWIEIIGTLFFLFPMVALVLFEAWPWALRAIASKEISASAGGLILWPAKVLVPIGFGLLALQGVSELIKRVAFLLGKGPDPSERIVEKSAEQQLAEE